MKKYIKPEMEMKLFETEDVITTSGTGSEDSPNYRKLKTSVNGNEGTPYGSWELPKFDE